MPRHRAITSTGAVVDEPSVGELAELVAEVERSGRHAFLFVERRTGEAGETWVQASRDRDSWVLERRDGAPSRQYRAVVTDSAVVNATLAEWLLRVRGWTGIAWQHLQLGPVGVAPADVAPAATPGGPGAAALVRAC